MIWSWRPVVRWQSRTVRNFVSLNIHFTRLGKTSDGAGLAAFFASADAEKTAGVTIVVDGGLASIREKNGVREHAMEQS
jgi:NAD(P)-dependent dehydrogenase (short-subunit alcohol dehydrogenase family)